MGMPSAPLTWFKIALFSYMRTSIMHLLDFMENVCCLAKYNHRDITFISLSPQRSLFLEHRWSQHLARGPLIDRESQSVEAKSEVKVFDCHMYIITQGRSEQ